MKLNWFDRLVFYLNSLAAFGLAMAMVAGSVSPADFWPLAFFGLCYPYFLLINLFFIFFWLLRKKWLLLLSVIVIGVGYQNVPRIFAINSPVLADKEKVSLNVMSYNVQNFDLYNWTENQESRDKMLSLIQNEDPDVICFQEFYTEDENDFHNIKKLINELNFEDYHFEKTLSLSGSHHWGLAIFSKFPIVESGKIKLEGTKGNLITYSDVKVAKDQLIRFYNVHLQSIKLLPDDYEAIKNLPENRADFEDSKSVLRKFKMAFEKRSNQAEILHNAIHSSEVPVVVCGDFNDTPGSYAYNTIAKDLKDSFVERGFGMGSTYTGPVPSFRIDYILTDPSFEILQHKVIQEKISDHFPISCQFHF